MSLKEFREEKQKTNIEVLTKKYGDVLKNVVKKSELLSESALLSIVILSETSILEKEYKEELIVHGLITPEEEITEAGIALIESKETINKIKTILQR